MKHKCQIQTGVGQYKMQSHLWELEALIPHTSTFKWGIKLDLSQEAQKLLVKIKKLSLFYYRNYTFKDLMADNFWAPWDKSKLYTSSESAGVWY